MYISMGHSQIFWKSKPFGSLIALANALAICMRLICPNGSFCKDGQNSEDIQQAAEQLRSRWVDFCALLAERLAWLAYQTKVLAFHNLFQQLEQAVATAENWLKVQSPPASEPEPLRIQLDRCRVTVDVCPCAWGPFRPQICLMCVCSVSICRVKVLYVFRQCPSPSACANLISVGDSWGSCNTLWSCSFI